MTKPDFEFDEKAVENKSWDELMKNELPSQRPTDENPDIEIKWDEQQDIQRLYFIEGARYQHSIDLAKHEEINSDLQTEIAKLKANLDKAINCLKSIRDFGSGPPFDYYVELLQEEAREVLKEIEGEK